MEQKKLKKMFALVLLICIDLLLCPLSIYMDKTNLLTFWVLIPFEIIHIVPFLIWLEVLK